jgi:cobalt-zinc-cadmium efflux system protein
VNEHTHDRAAHRRLLTISIAITAALLVIEVAGGILTHSLALVADGGHMATDLGTLALSLGAVMIASRPATAGRTYGLARAEILAAFVNSLALLAIACFVFWEAARRLSDPADVTAAPMLAVAAGGLAVNLFATRLLSRARHQSLNMRSAFLHVLGDTLASLGVIVAAVLILATGENRIDPAVSIAIGALILAGSFRIIWETAQVLLEATPPGVHTTEVQQGMLAVPGVRSVHDLHIWTVTSGFISLSAHVETDPSPSAHEILVDLRRLLSRNFGIDHATLQLESLTLHLELDSCCGVDTEKSATPHAVHHV